MIFNLSNTEYELPRHLIRVSSSKSMFQHSNVSNNTCLSSYLLFQML